MATAITVAAITATAIVKRVSVTISMVRRGAAQRFRPRMDGGFCNAFPVRDLRHAEKV